MSKLSFASFNFHQFTYGFIFLYLTFSFIFIKIASVTNLKVDALQIPRKKWGKKGNILLHNNKRTKIKV